MQSMNAMLQSFAIIAQVRQLPSEACTKHSTEPTQEMANPRVRPHLSFYPEDAGQRLCEARQAARWLHEAPGDQLTPMARIGSKDFYVYEPAMLTDGSICMPSRWFLRDGTLFAKCWSLLPVNGGSWRVVACNDFEVSERQFLKNFPDLESDRHHYGLPTLCNITDIFDPITRVSTPWTLTNPAVGNRWRGLAREVVWFRSPFGCTAMIHPAICRRNGTSTTAFLCFQLDYHEQKRRRSTTFTFSPHPILHPRSSKRIWSWDCIYGEPILVIPMILALLGDNPMQSEFACHIGLRGKYFCRACWVKGSDALDADMPTNEPQANPGSDARDSGSEAASDASDDQTSMVVQPRVRRRKGKFKESLQQIVDRVGAFINIGKLRSKHETVNSLQSQFIYASTPGSKTRVKAMRTETGIKDTYQLHFVEQLFDSVKGKRGEAAKQAAIDAKLRSFPSNVTSPVWRINGQSWPSHRLKSIVELIENRSRSPPGYSGGDLTCHSARLCQVFMERPSSEPAEEQDQGARTAADPHILLRCVWPRNITTCWNNFGAILGSLTGRDFRAIAQVAPFVAYDLVSAECLATWVSLSKLIPLVWQPDIFGVDDHIGNRIRHLLSGGLFPNVSLIPLETSGQPGVLPTRPFIFPHSAEDWHTIGSGPKNLVASTSTVTSYLGLSSKATDTVGTCISDKRPSRAYSLTLSGEKCPTAASQIDVKTYSRVVLANGDTCDIGGHVIAHDEASIGSTYVGWFER
ncbi:hypothetical protein IMY05_C4770000700 [Salix suchowensis]|nr:hypothetical protein IMY05_C4770000700 [Salix suchowensis]